jgi:uncharacterized protein (TIGR02145 family)
MMKKGTFFSRSPIFLLAFILLFVFSCQKDDSTTSDNPNGDPTNSTGRFSDHLTCTIISVPGEVNLPSIYTKYINCSGIPVVGTSGVSDEALIVADQTIEFMLTGLGNVRDRLITSGNYAVLYHEGLTLDDLPGFQSSGTATGQYVGQLQAFASDEESLMCNPEKGYGHTLVHEFAHMMHLSAIQHLNSGFQSQLNNVYNSAISNGLWNNTYAATTSLEYLAEGVTIWYGVNSIGPDGGDGWRNEIGHRGDLQNYDPAFFNLINDNFNSLTDMPGCRLPLIPGASANCPGTVTDIDGNVYEVVNIGPLCVMKENLKTTRYSNGNPIPNLTDYSEWENTSSGAWANYENDPAQDAIFGKLYNWYALNNPGLCPEGWHVPDINELQAIVNYAGGDHKAKNLRSTILWDPFNPDNTNSIGFSALPSGERHESGNYQGIYHETFFGSTTVRVDNDGSYYSKSIYGDNDYVFNGTPDKNFGTPCRCVKD